MTTPSRFTAALLSVALALPLTTLAQAEGNAPAAAAPMLPLAQDVERFAKEATFKRLELSPGGEFYAATVEQADRTVLAIFRRDTREAVGGLQLGPYTHVSRFWWVNPTRVVLEVSRNTGAREEPWATGDLYTVSTDGSRPKVLAGPRAMTQQTGSNIRARDDGQNYAFFIDGLRNSEEHILVALQDINATAEAYTTAVRMSAEDGRRTLVARAPVRSADFVADHAGQVRFAVGFDLENISHTYYRADDKAEWTLLSKESDCGCQVFPIGFSADNATAYLRVRRTSGVDVIEAMALATLQRTPVLSDAVSDPHEILFDPATDAPIGAVYMDGLPRARYFDGNEPASRRHRSLTAAFAGEQVSVASATADGALQLLMTHSDRNAGDFYLFDNKTAKAEHVVSAMAWLDPAAMAPMKPIQLKARDGLVLHGYLTVPVGRDAKNLPLVVHPHGGPIGVRDDWAFQPEVQLMAARGYAVLQLNYRGSAGFGAPFEVKGYRQWGKTMQDDLTDATRWAIEQGIADPQRICLYGASYGGYAALMGAAKEPGLYRCAVGSVGVYDLGLRYRDGLAQETRTGRNALDLTMGREGLDEVSPTRLAARIDVPVLLAAGGKDERAPQEHTKLMERALKDAGKSVEAVYYPTEGHGFYDPANVRDEVTPGA